MFLNKLNILYFVRTSSLALFLLTSSAYAVTGYLETDEHNTKFVRSLNDLKTSLLLPVFDTIENITIPIKKLKTRVRKGGAASLVEPLSLIMPKDEDKIMALAKKIAKPNETKALNSAFIEQLKKIGPTQGPTVKIDINVENFALMDPEKVAEVLAKPHHNVTIDSAMLLKQPQQRATLLEQLASYFSRDEINRLADKLRDKKNLKVDTDLLPTFARKMVKKFIVVKGPNCFHAALAFQSQKLTRSPFINVKQEEGYHRAMINYDELWRVIGRTFYEIDPTKYPLKYGDMIVFFNLPAEWEESMPINFRWIRHTATYLFGPYTFSKGSKSPDTPYSVKTIGEEWTTWEEYSHNLGVKVYRRSQKISSDKLPEDLVDWIY